MTERALALAMVRIAKLEDENASTFGGQARHIAELEATLTQERHTYASVADQLKARIAELEAERDRLLIAEEDAKLFILLHALAIEHGYMPDPGESAYDLLQRAIMTNSPASIRARLEL